MSQEDSQTSAMQKFINKNLRQLRTITTGRVSRVLSNGWLEVIPQVSALVRNPDTLAVSDQPLQKLTRVPVGYYKAGGFVLTLPTSAGDEGILIVCDRSMDLWKATGKVASPNSGRMHDLSDAIFVPWPTSNGGAIAFDPDRMIMGKEDGSAVISIGKVDGDILLKSPVEITCEAPSTIVKSPTVELDAADVNLSGNLTTLTGVITAKQFVDLP